jgi:hypothetical protein
MASKNVIYVAWGEHHVAEACKSLRSVREHNDGVTGWLFTDDIDLNIPFDYVHKIDVFRNRPMTKVGGIIDACKKVSGDVLYLDNDTKCLGDISGLLGKLPYSFAMAYAPYRRTPGTHSDRTPMYPDFNTGVMSFNTISGRGGILNQWFRECNKDTKSDQAIISGLLYDLWDDWPDHFVHVLPPEYNARPGWPFCVQREVKILHGRGTIVDECATQINQRPNLVRVWIPRKGVLYK